jgi:hypothetical protein
MRHAELKADVIATSLRLIDESTPGETTGDTGRLELGLEPNAPGLYDAFFAAKEEGSLRCDFPGGMQLPYRVRRIGPDLVCERRPLGGSVQLALLPPHHEA